MVGQRHVARHRPMPAPNQPHIRDCLMQARGVRVVANVVRAPMRPATRWTLVVSMASATLISGKVVVRQRASLDVPAPGLQRRRGPRSEYACAPRAPGRPQGANGAGGADGAGERVGATMMAAGLQGGATLRAKLGPLGSVSFAAWTAPGGILLRGWASGRGYLWAKAPAPVSDRCELDGVSVLQPCSGVKRKA
jgi:hypothetical protein